MIYSVRFFRRLLRLRKKERNMARHIDFSHDGVTLAALSAETLVFGFDVPPGYIAEGEIWITDSAALMSARLDAGGSAGTLILRHAVVPILQRLERVRLAGWRVLWWPEDEGANEDALVVYARSNCDGVHAGEIA